MEEGIGSLVIDVLCFKEIWGDYVAGNFLSVYEQ